MRYPSLAGYFQPGPLQLLLPNFGQLSGTQMVLGKLSVVLVLAWFLWHIGQILASRLTWIDAPRLLCPSGLSTFEEYGMFVAGCVFQSCRWTWTPSLSKIPRPIVVTAGKIWLRKKWEWFPVKHILLPPSLILHAQHRNCATILRSSWGQSHWTALCSRGFHRSFVTTALSFLKQLRVWSHSQARLTLLVHLAVQCHGSQKKGTKGRLMCWWGEMTAKQQTYVNGEQKPAHIF